MERPVPDRLTWGDDRLLIEIEWAEDRSPGLRRMVGGDGVDIAFTADQPLVELTTAAHGHTPANDRLVDTRIGPMLRYRSHDAVRDGDADTLTLRMAAEDAGLEVLLTLCRRDGAAAVRSSVTVINRGDDASVVLRSVTSWVAPFGFPATASGPDFDSWHLISGRNDWLAEGRWDQQRLRGSAFPRLHQELTGHQPKSSLSVVSTGTWSTGRQLPVGSLVSHDHRLAWLWQVEHNGPWRWEVGERTGDGYVALSGPTDVDHDWTAVLAPGEAFTSVPVVVAIGRDLHDGVRELTAYRRASRRSHIDNTELRVVFNDYMNTLNGDPTTEKLLPLIQYAADCGAEIFCIDAGWYDDGGDWWDSVGEWQPSTTRFPGGLGEVIDAIRDRGMVPGLWLEPEVVGVRSPAAVTLPDEAFFRADGVRMVEHERYHLDLTHPAARAHLDEVVDRLVNRFGVGYFKLDYNINPGTGTTDGSASAGAALLAHNRAHAEWLDGVLDRHPELILENCGSGGMRADWAMLSRLQLQSTSDQQDFRSYPPIAASAPLSMLPEQAANWAYPQADMNDEHLAFSLATAMLGRFYLSGYLNRMSEEQRRTVAEAVATWKSIRGDIARSAPFWPLGMPHWEAPWVALGLDVSNGRGSRRLVTLWSRSLDDTEVTLPLAELAGSDLEVRTVFPARLPAWASGWDAERGELRLTNGTGELGARTLELVTR